MAFPIKGNSIPPATTAERDAEFTSVPNGFIFYNTDTDRYEYTIDGGTSWLEAANLNDVTGGESSNSGLAIVTSTGMTTPSIIYQSQQKVGSVVICIVKYTFTATAVFHDITFSLPFNSNNFVSTSQAGGCGSLGTGAATGFEGKVYNVESVPSSQNAKIYSSSTVAFGAKDIGASFSYIIV